MRFFEFDRSHDTPDSSISLDPHRGDYELRNYHKLDKYLKELCDLVDKGQQSNKDFGMVAAGILPLRGEYMARLNRPSKNGRTHAEHAVIEDFIKKYGSIPEGSVILTTLSPCNTHMDERDGPSCADLLNEHGIQKVYCGFIDPTQHHGSEDKRDYNLVETQDKKLRTRCEQFASTFLNLDEDMGKTKPATPDITTPTGIKGIDQAGDKFVGVGDPKRGFAVGIGKPIGSDDVKPTLRYSAPIAGSDNTVSGYIAPHRAGINFNVPFENFADGKNPEDKGDSKRYHVPTKGSVSSLRKFAKGHHGRAAQLAHWMANMKSGHKK